MQSQTKGGLGAFGGYLRDSAHREINGARNAIPGTRNWDWRQSLDAAVLPGNWYDSQGGGWQNPASGLFQGVRDLFGRNNSPNPSPNPPGPGAPLPSWMTPGSGPAPTPPGFREPSWDTQLPYQDQTYAGPPSNPYYGNGQGPLRPPTPNQFYGSGNGMFPNPPPGPAYGEGNGVFPQAPETGGYHWTQDQGFRPPAPARRPSGPGVRGGHVIAQGQDAQNMVEGMRQQGPGNDWLRMMQQYAAIR